MSFILYKKAWISNLPPHRSSFLPDEKCNELLNRGGEEMCIIGILCIKLHFGLS